MLALLHHLPITTARGQSMVRDLALTSAVLVIPTGHKRGSDEGPGSSSAAEPKTGAVPNDCGSIAGG
jgi:hypothetical protein